MVAYSLHVVQVIFEYHKIFAYSIDVQMQVQSTVWTVRFLFTIIHAMFTTYIKLKWLVNHILSYPQSVHTALATYTKLEWFVNHILLFSLSIHMTYEMYTDYHHPVWGSLRLSLINHWIMIKSSRIDKIHLWSKAVVISQLYQKDSQDIIVINTWPGALPLISCNNNMCMHIICI